LLWTARRPGYVLSTTPATPGQDCTVSIPREGEDEASRHKGDFIVKRPARLLQVLAVVITLLSTKNVFAQQVTIPEGTVIELRMDTVLNSQDSQLNDTFKASVLRTLWIDGRVAIRRAARLMDG
jgi:hypothetical protein